MAPEKTGSQMSRGSIRRRQGPIVLGRKDGIFPPQAKEVGVQIVPGPPLLPETEIELAPLKRAGVARVGKIIVQERVFHALPLF